MPPLTIILSGPRASEQQARNALAAARFDVLADDHDYGLPALATGEDTREAQSFVHVQGDDVDKAAEAVSPLGWALRMHHQTPEPSEPGAEQRIAADMAEMRELIAAQRRELDELKGRI